MEKKNESLGLNADNLLILLWRWKKSIILVMCLAVVGSAVVSLIIKEKFLSTAIIFPVERCEIFVARHTVVEAETKCIELRTV